MKSKGYTLITFDSGHAPTRFFEISDIHLCSDVDSLESELVPLYLRTTMLNPIHVQFFAGDYRDRILCIFTSLSKIPDIDEKPKFVFAYQ